MKRNTLKIIDNKLPLFTTTSYIIIVGMIVYLHLYDSPSYLWVMPLFCLGESAFAAYIYKHIDMINFGLDKNNDVNEKTIFWICCAIVICGQLLYWCMYYPGGFNLDALGQWDQVHGLQQLNNWHPILTTFFYWLVTRFNDSLQSCILVQLFLFTVSIAYLLKVLYAGGVNIRLIIISAFFIGLNPAIGMNNVCLIKDVPFTITLVWIFIMMYKVCLSNGEWLISLKCKLILILLLSALSLIRHNAILLTIPLTIIAFIAYKKYYKEFIKIIVTTCLMVTFVETALFYVLNVQQHNNLTGEMSGVFMSIMANAYVNDYDDTPDDVKEFLEGIAPYEQWEKFYIVGEWDSCKWEFGGIELLKNKNIAEIIDMTYETIVNCPNASYEAFKENTRVVWQVVGTSYWSPWIYVEENEYGIRENKKNIWIENMILASENNVITAILFWNTGFIIICMLILNWIAIAKGKTQSTIFVGSVVVYDLSTMFLLSGPSFRYFYFNSVLFLPIIGIILNMISGINEKKHISFEGEAA